MYELKYDPNVCARCKTVDCLMRCQYITITLDEAQREKRLILDGERSRVLDECVTCYACEEYCPNTNHPFFQIVERQEQLGVWPAPIPLTKQQVRMMAPKGDITPQSVNEPLVNMCYFPMLTGSIRGKLFDNTSLICGSDIFCNIMWLHFAKASVIKERLPRVINTIQDMFLKDVDIQRMICFHDECYGTYTYLAPAFGIEVPFQTMHLFEYLVGRLKELKKDIRPLNVPVAYQRPCSNRLIPETQPWVDEIFSLIGADRVPREYDRDNALCCGTVIRAMQRDEQADDVQKRNMNDMESAGVRYCVFNCPACFFTMREMVQERGITPIMMSDLCHMALSE